MAENGLKNCFIDNKTNEFVKEKTMFQRKINNKQVIRVKNA